MVFPIPPLSVTENSVFLFWLQVTLLGLSSRPWPRGQHVVQVRGEALAQHWPSAAPVGSCLIRDKTRPCSDPESCLQSFQHNYLLHFSNLSSAVYSPRTLVDTWKSRILSPSPPVRIRLQPGTNELTLTEVVGCSSPSNVSLHEICPLLPLLIPNRTIWTSPKYLTKKGIRVTQTCGKNLCSSSRGHM